MVLGSGVRLHTLPITLFAKAIFNRSCRKLGFFRQIPFHTELNAIFFRSLAIILFDLIQIYFNTIFRIGFATTVLLNPFNVIENEIFYGKLMKKIKETDLEFNGVQMCCIVKIHTKSKSKKRKLNYCMSSMSLEFSGYTTLLVIKTILDSNISYPFGINSELSHFVNNSYSFRITFMSKLAKVEQHTTAVFFLILFSLFICIIV